MSKDYLMAWLNNNKINYLYKEIKDPRRNWRWLIEFDNYKIYLLRCNRFLFISYDEEGVMIGFTYIKAKEDLIQRLEGCYGK